MLLFKYVVFILSYVVSSIFFVLLELYELLLTSTLACSADINVSEVNSRTRQVLDYISDSDSDVDTAMLDSVWRGHDQESSDAESVDSQNEDPLK